MGCVELTDGTFRNSADLDASPKFFSNCKCSHTSRKFFFLGVDHLSECEFLLSRHRRVRFEGFSMGDQREGEARRGAILPLR